MSFNRKQDDDVQTEKVETLSKEKETVEEIENTSTTDETLRIYICATMWHETAEEIVTFLKSVFTVDKSQYTKEKIQKVHFEEF